MSDQLDRRVNAYRDDLASKALMGKVQAGKFIEGERRNIIQPVVDMRPTPDNKIGIDTQLIYGDIVRVFEEEGAWAWVQSLRDNYVGYIDKKALSPSQSPLLKATHRICYPRSFAYRQPDMKTPASHALSIGSAICVVGKAETRGTKFVETADGFFIIAHHLIALDETDIDYVSVAETLLHTPYLWGGTSGFGIDCSGLVQICMLMAGEKVMRDTDMQAHTIGAELGFAAMDGGLKRGDLIFWKGHVGIMCDTQKLIHANGHTMTVANELLEDAVERIGYLYGFPTAIRRP